MLIQFQNFLTFENIYLWTNFGVLPFWLMLIFIPNSKITRIFVNSIILPLILSSIYCYVIYQTILLDEPVVEIFKQYLDLDSLYTKFTTESLLLLFWIHYVTLNLFLGSWISRDGVKYSGSSVSGYQISSFLTQQRGLWEAFLGLSFQGKYYYDLRSEGSELIHDRRVNWVNFLLGLGLYY